MRPQEFCRRLALGGYGATVESGQGMSPHRVRSLGAASAVVAVAAILLATLMPNLAGPVAAGQFASWGVHFLLFATFGLTVGLAVMTTTRSRVRLLQLVLLVALFAAADELAQQWVDGRAVELQDWIADALGGGLGVAMGGSAGRYLMLRRAG